MKNNTAKIIYIVLILALILTLSFSVLKGYLGRDKAAKEPSDISYYIPYREDVIGVDRDIKAYGGWKLDKIGEDRMVIEMDNHYLCYSELPESDADIEAAADSLQEFFGFLDEKGIDHLYLNMGSKTSPVDRQMPITNMECTNENGDRFQTALETRGIEYVDMRDELLQSGRDWYGSFYIADNHWTTDTQLWLAGDIAGILNKDYGYNFDLSTFDKTNYNSEVHPTYWLGSQGRAVTAKRAPLDDFEIITPKFETSLTVTVPSRGEDITGPYADSYFNRELFDDIASYTDDDHLNKPDAYSCIRIGNERLAHVHNNLPTGNEGKKILFLYDSYSHYIASYLALGIEDVDIIHLPNTDESVRKYIEETKPDMVLVMYAERNIMAPDYSSHISPFDFR